MKRLEGQVAVLTGGNSGIGLAAAKRLQEEGAKIAIFDRSRKTLDEAVKTIGNGVVAVQRTISFTALSRRIVMALFRQQLTYGLSVTRQRRYWSRVEGGV
jgi:NAD(P)-dependent dehydrogenase (short-subunit alcohol dehydrogenase family)